VRYVLRAAGRLHEDFRPAPDGFIATRARQVLSEAVDLLERICDHTLLQAIADGTFGLMRRPPDGGRGADGVVRRAAGYYNPASELLERHTQAAAPVQPEEPRPALADAGGRPAHRAWAP
jgi:beta-lysine 5,6-aminomutase alpha subunit